MSPPELLESDPAKLPLTIAVNVDVTLTNGIERRRGMKKLQDISDGHTLWSDGGVCFIGAGTSLYQVNKDLTLTLLRSDLTKNAKLYFACVGDRTFYTNTFEYGIIKDGILYNWVQTPYVGPDTSASFSFPVQGKYLSLYHGRLYCAVGRTLHWTEYMDYGKTRRSRNFADLPQQINFIAPSDDCMWVGLEHAIVCLVGMATKEFSLQLTADYSAIEGTVAKVPAGKFDNGTWHFVNTEEGICALGPGAQFRNLTSNTVVVDGTIGCAAVFPSNKYVTSFK